MSPNVQILTIMTCAIESMIPSLCSQDYYRGVLSHSFYDKSNILAKQQP